MYLDYQFKDCEQIQYQRHLQQHSYYQQIINIAVDYLQKHNIEDKLAYDINYIRCLANYIANNAVNVKREVYKDIISLITEIRNNNIDFKANIKKDVNPKDWVEEVFNRAFFISSKDLPNLINVSLKQVESLQEVCETGKIKQPKANSSNLIDKVNVIIKSTIQGAGKSRYISNIIDGAIANGVKAHDNVSIPRGSFYNPIQYSTNAIVGMSECGATITPMTQEVLKAITRKETYQFEEKCKNPVNVQGRSIIWGTTNYNTPMDDRAFITLNTNNISYQELSKEHQEAIQEPFTNYLKLNITAEAMKEAKKFASNYELPIDFNSSKDCKLTKQQLRTIQSLADWKVWFKVCKEMQIKDILNNSSIVSCKDIYNATLGTINAISLAEMYNLSRLFAQLAKLKIIKRTNNNSQEYAKFDISNIINVDEDTFSYGNGEDDEELKLFNKVKQDFIDFFATLPTLPADNESKDGVDIDSLFDSFETEDNKEDEEEMFLIKYDTLPDEEPTTYKSVKCVKPTNNVDDPYETINPICKDSNRANDSVKIMRNMVFEMDDTSLDEQVKIAKEAINNGLEIYEMVYSGNKSIHFKVSVNYNLHDTAEYKYVHNRINDEFFKGKADRACSNPSRLCRKLNGIRILDDGTKVLQKGKKLSNKPFDAIYLHKEYKNSKKAISTNSEQMPRKETLRETFESWKESEWKENCLAILDGIGNYEDVYGFLCTCAKCGFEWDEIESEVEFGSWNVSEDYYESIKNKLM